MDRHVESLSVVFSVDFPSTYETTPLRSTLVWTCVQYVPKQSVA